MTCSSAGAGPATSRSIALMFLLPKLAGEPNLQNNYWFGSEMASAATVIIPWSRPELAARPRLLRFESQTSEGRSTSGISSAISQDRSHADTLWHVVSSPLDGPVDRCVVP
jgi:hypothetical protein